VVFENSPSDHETWSIWWHVGIHVDFTSILLSLTPFIPRALCEVNSDRLRLFHQWECLKCTGHGPSISCVKWPLRYSSSTWLASLPTKATQYTYAATKRPLTNWAIILILCLAMDGFPNNTDFQCIRLRLMWVYTRVQDQRNSKVLWSYWLIAKF
jgi:hypothetical protein